MNPERPYWDELKSRTSGYTDIGCGDGWDILLRMTDAALKTIDPDYQIAQIKEKFGGLRYYISVSENVTEEQRELMYDIERMAEALSYSICEKCGATNDVETKGWGTKYWITTLCAPCGVARCDEVAARKAELAQKSDVL